jgi:ribosomal protein L16 Arg81 hydroxylase
MASTLRTLIAPFEEIQFLELLRARSLTLLHSADESRFDGLLSWITLLEVINDIAIPSNDLRVTVNNRAINPELYSIRGKFCSAKLQQLLAQGASVIVSRLDTRVFELRALCSDITAQTHEAAYAGCIATTGCNGAFGLHYDPQDLIILQLEGSKRWKVYGPPANLPSRRAVKPPPQLDLVFDDIVCRGDLLVLPAGYWHRCENGEGRSLHIGLFIEPPTGCHAFEGLLSKLYSEELFRTPLTRIGGAADMALHETALKARLKTLIAEMTLSEMLAQYESYRLPDR